MEAGQQEELYFDAHNHLLDYSQQQLSEVIAEAVGHHVRLCAPNATREAEYSRMIDLANQYPVSYWDSHNLQSNQNFQVVPSFGLHPYFLQHEVNNAHWLQNLQKVISEKEHYCIGQIGIDFRKEVLEVNSKEVQYQFFTKQLELSMLANRTVTVHCVRAHGELLKIFKKYNKLFETGPTNQKLLTQREQLLRKVYKRNPIIMHSYGGSKEITSSLLKLTNMNIYFSLCLKRSEELCPVIPIEKLILETDAPYQNNVKLLREQNIFTKQLTEEEQRQYEKKNRIQYVRANVGSLYKFYNIERKSFSRIIFENTLRVFQLIKTK